MLFTGRSVFVISSVRRHVNSNSFISPGGVALAGFVQKNIKVNTMEIGGIGASVSSKSNSNVVRAIHNLSSRPSAYSSVKLVKSPVSPLSPASPASTGNGFGATTSTRTPLKAATPLSPAKSLSVWQVVLKRAANIDDEKRARFSAMRGLISQKNSELTRRLRINYESNKLSTLLDMDSVSAKDSRYGHAREKLKKQIASHGILCDVEEGEELTCTYRLQGNLDMYSQENQYRRKKVQFHETIQSVLQDWWQLMPKVSGFEAGEKVRVVDVDIYSWVGRTLFKNFVPFSGEEECKMCIEKDWAHDSCGKGYMDQAMFAHAMFQFADIWCETADVREYHDLLLTCMRLMKEGRAYSRSKAVEEEWVARSNTLPPPATQAELQEATDVQKANQEGAGDDASSEGRGDDSKVGGRKSSRSGAPKAPAKGDERKTSKTGVALRRGSLPERRVSVLEKRKGDGDKKEKDKEKEKDKSAGAGSGAGRRGTSTERNVANAAAAKRGSLARDKLPAAKNAPEQKGGRRASVPGDRSKRAGAGEKDNRGGGGVQQNGSAHEANRNVNVNVSGDVRKHDDRSGPVPVPASDDAERSSSGGCTETVESASPQADSRGDGDSVRRKDSEHRQGGATDTKRGAYSRASADSATGGGAKNNSGTGESGSHEHGNTGEPTVTGSVSEGNASPDAIGTAQAHNAGHNDSDGNTRRTGSGDGAGGVTGTTVDTEESGTNNLGDAVTGGADAGPGTSAGRAGAVTGTPTVADVEGTGGPTGTGGTNTGGAGTDAGDVGAGGPGMGAGIGGPTVGQGGANTGGAGTDAGDVGAGGPGMGAGIGVPTVGQGGTNTGGAGASDAGDVGTGEPGTTAGGSGAAGLGPVTSNPSRGNTPSTCRSNAGEPDNTSDTTRNHNNHTTESNHDSRSNNNTSNNNNNNTDPTGNKPHDTTPAGNTTHEDASLAVAEEETDAITAELAVIDEELRQNSIEGALEDARAELERMDHREDTEHSEEKAALHEAYAEAVEELEAERDELLAELDSARQDAASPAAGAADILLDIATAICTDDNGESASLADSFVAATHKRLAEIDAAVSHEKEVFRRGKKRLKSLQRNALERRIDRELKTTEATKRPKPKKKTQPQPQPQTEGDMQSLLNEVNKHIQPTDARTPPSPSTTDRDRDAQGTDPAPSSSSPFSKDELSAYFTAGLEQSVERRQEMHERRKAADASAVSRVRERGAQKRIVLEKKAARMRAAVQQTPPPADGEDDVHEEVRRALQSQLADLEGQMQQDQRREEHRVRTIQRRAGDRSESVLRDIRHDESLVQRKKRRLGPKGTTEADDDTDEEECEGSTVTHVESLVDDFSSPEWQRLVDDYAAGHARHVAKIRKAAARHARDEDEDFESEQRRVSRLHTKRKEDMQAQLDLLQIDVKKGGDAEKERVKSVHQRKKKEEADMVFELRAEEEEMKARRKAAIERRTALEKDLQVRERHVKEEVEQLRKARTRKDVTQASKQRILYDDEQTKLRHNKAALHKKPNTKGGSDATYDAPDIARNGGGGGFGKGMRFGAANGEYQSSWDGLPTYVEASSGKHHVLLSQQKGAKGYEEYLEGLHAERDRRLQARLQHMERQEAAQADRDAQWREWLRQRHLDDLAAERRRLERLQNVRSMHADWQAKLQARLLEQEARATLAKRRLSQKISDRDKRLRAFLEAKRKAALALLDERRRQWEARTRRRYERQRQEDLLLVKRRQCEARERIFAHREAHAAKMALHPPPPRRANAPPETELSLEAAFARKERLRIQMERTERSSRDRAARKDSLHTHEHLVTVLRKRLQVIDEKKRRASETSSTASDTSTLVGDREDMETLGLSSPPKKQGLSASKKLTYDVQNQKRVRDRTRFAEEMARLQQLNRERVEREREEAQLRRAMLIEIHNRERQQQHLAQSKTPVYAGVQNHYTPVDNSIFNTYTTQPYAEPPKDLVVHGIGRNQPTTSGKPNGSRVDLCPLRTTNEQNDTWSPFVITSFNKGADVVGQAGMMVSKDDLLGDTQNLDSTTWRLSSKEFEVRREEYMKEGLSLREVYVSECRRHNVKPNSLFTRTCPTTPLLFDLNVMDLTCNYIASILPFVDLIRLCNDSLLRIILKDNGLTNDSVVLLCETLQNSETVAELDLSGNKHLTLATGKALLQLIKKVPTLEAVHLKGTAVPTYLIKQINNLVEWNKSGKKVTADQVAVLGEMFDEIDVGRRGRITEEEVRVYTSNESLGELNVTPRLPKGRHSVVKGQGGGTQGSVRTHAVSNEQLKKGILQRIQNVFATQPHITFLQMLKEAFPHTAHHTIIKAAAGLGSKEAMGSELPDISQANGGNPTSPKQSVDRDELREFFDAYSIEGRLTLEQVFVGFFWKSCFLEMIEKIPAKMCIKVYSLPNGIALQNTHKKHTQLALGMGEEGNLDSLRPIFMAYDSNGDVCFAFI